jgi:hypothetical protein
LLEVFTVNNINGLAKSLDSVGTKGESTITEQIKELSEEKEDKKVELEQIEQEKIRIENNINETIIPYETFLNFFQNAEQIIQSNTDVYLLDQLIRNVFLNFSVRGKKVISHKLKEPFATYEKLGVFNMGSTQNYTSNFLDLESWIDLTELNQIAIVEQKYETSTIEAYGNKVNEIDFII